MERQLEHDEVLSRSIKSSLIPELILYVDNVQLSHNIAGIFRLADIFAVKSIVLTGNNEFIFSKKFRSIARTHESTLSYQVLDTQKGVAYLQNMKLQYNIISLEYTDLSSPIKTMNNIEPTILVIGSESHGVSSEVLSICKDSFHIPMMGSISSMNVCTALAVALYEFRTK